MGGRGVSAPVGRWTLVIAVLCGVIAMHALVLGHSTHTSAASAPPTHTPSAAAPGSAPPGQAVATPVPYGPSSAVTMPWAETGTGHHATSPATGDTAGDPTGGHAPSGHDHGLLHLCLAVLTVLAGLLAVPLLARASLPGGPGAGPGPVHGPRIRTAPARPPPPSAVRLAQLCVLRT